MQPQRNPHNRGPKHARTQSAPPTPLQPCGIRLLEHAHPPLKFARRHHPHAPRLGGTESAHYRDMQRVALANAVREFEENLGIYCLIECLDVQNQQLIVRYCSQSKLSQQELADLQKATHFDKKELQQWYKGAHRVY